MVTVMAMGPFDAPSLTPEQQVVAEAVDAAEATVNEGAFAGKTEGFVRMWLDRATKDGAERLARLAAVEHGVFCFIVAGLDVALESVKVGYAAKGLALPRGLEKVDRILGQWQEECRGPGGKAAETEWLELGKLLVGLGKVSGPLSRSAAGLHILARLATRELPPWAWIGLCNPSGWCAEPRALADPRQALITAAVLVLGLVPWSEPVTVPVLLQLAAL
jgi:hypothetical protein